MQLLLDTHVLLWALLEPHQLSARVVELLEDQTNELLASSASAWEIATKYRLGKLPEAQEVAHDYLGVTRKLEVRHLAISVPHALTAANFHVAHKDPFDRMLAAQSLHEGVDLVTKDSCFAVFPIRTIW